MVIDQIVGQAAGGGTACLVSGDEPSDAMLEAINEWLAMFLIAYEVVNQLIAGDVLIGCEGDDMFLVPVGQGPDSDSPSTLN